LIWEATATLRLSFRWWNKGSAGPARSSPQPPRQRRWPAGPGLRAPVRSIIIVPGMRVLRACRGRLGQGHGSTRLPTARREPAVRSPGHEPRSHPATRSAASPHIRPGVGHPHHNPSCTRARGSGRAGSFSETGILQPWGPTTTARPDPRNQLGTGSRTGSRLRFSSSRRPPPGQCPAWQTATARSEAFARQQRSLSAGCAGSQRTRQTSG
jgi:hypothetical protein